MSEKTGELPLETIEEYFERELGENSEDFLILKRLVEESDGVISWEKLKEYTKIENGKVEGIYWKGNLDLSGTKVKSLGELEKVGGYLDLRGTNVRSLGKLKEVGDQLYCYGLESLEDLGELEKVGGNLYLGGTKVRSLGKLKEVGWNLNCYGLELESLEDLGELEKVGGNLYLRGTKVKSLGKLKEVGDQLDCEGLESLEDLGELEKVGGALYLKGTTIRCQFIFKRKQSMGEIKVGGKVKLDYGLEYISHEIIEFETGSETLVDIDKYQEKYKRGDMGRNDALKKELAKNGLWIVGEYMKNLEEEVKKLKDVPKSKSESMDRLLELERMKIERFKLFKGLFGEEFISRYESEF